MLKKSKRGPFREFRPQQICAFAQLFAWCFVFAGLVLVAQSASALTLSLLNYTPAAGPNDIYNFAGASHDGVNVCNGTQYADGGANDIFTYVAGDRSGQGQTFTTGNSSNGTVVTAIWARHAGYTNNTALTWWQMNSGVTLTVRITDPSQAGTAGFAVRAETYTTTGNEGWSGSRSSINGDGYWLRFAFATPLTLAMNKTYGFDLTSATTGAFFEWLGTSNNVFAGSAYKGSTAGIADNTMNTLVGDRVFLIEMVGSTATNPPPATNYVSYGAPLTGADPFPNERVQLLDSRFFSNREMHHLGYLGWLNTNADRLLWPFRNNAGLSQPAGATSLGGWEGTSGFTAVRGHMIGHFLSAAAREYAETGDTNFLNTINYIVAQLSQVQSALSTDEIANGLPYGYLAAFPSSYFTTLENTPASAQVPFYTVHKILAGLVDAYRYTTNNLALDMAIAISDYHQARMARLTAAQIEAMFVASSGHTEWGGMNEALTDLYLLSNARGDTNAARHLTFAEVFHRDWFVNPLSTNLDILATGENGGPLHANTHIPQVTGFARVASVLNTNDPQRSRLYFAASNFWHMVIGQHWLVLGGNSYSEHFSTAGKETGTGGNALTAATAETCNTYNMLKLTRQLFMHNPSVEYADYYEHALYNHILAGFETNKGMMTYFVPMISGHFKTYNQPVGSCWCCTGTGIENPTRYNEAIYFHKDAVLWVNLFIPSILNWSERGLTVRLDSGFPTNNAMTLTVHCPRPTNAAVRIRIPSWIAGAPTISLNGAIQSLNPAPGSYLELNRTWSEGDIVSVVLPMNLHVDHSMDDPTQSSLFYGPILLAGELGTNGMPVSDQAAGQLDYAGVSDVAAPALIGDDANNPSNWVSSDGTILGFNAAAAFSGNAVRSLVHLKPFYDVHHERYAVYWNLVAPTNVCAWSGSAGFPNWSLNNNWSSAPTNLCSIQFGLTAGGTTSNNLGPDLTIAGIQFPPAAGSFVLNGNSLSLQGDVVNNSSAAQQLNLPLVLTGGLPWRFTAAGNLILGGAVSGYGSFEKDGPNTLTVLSNLTFSGAVQVLGGQLQIGNGAASGSLGMQPVTVSSGASLTFNRSDTFVVANAVAGSGGVIKRGAGTILLASSFTNGGPTVIEAGALQITNQPVPVLTHRWSFNNSLADSVGTNNATVIDIGANNAVMSSSSITMAGGSRAASDYVALGSGLLPKDGTPVTIELWATTTAPQNWSRIFDIGSSTTDYLFMGWSQGTSTNLDRVEWKDATTSTMDNTCAPYANGVEYHIVMTIVPGGGSGGATRVTWYAAPAASSNLGAARGTFDTANTPASLNDVNFWLGRSEFTGDNTASASYNEVRFWNRTFSAIELQQLHTLGPDNIGTFATNTVIGRLSAQSDLVMSAGANLNLAGTMQEVASLQATSNSVIQLDGGQLCVGTGTNAATFAGSFRGPGSVVINGTLRLVRGGSIASGISFTNNGTLDVITWDGALPAGFVNNGTVVTRAAVQLRMPQMSGGDFRVSFPGYSGHNYQLQVCDDLTTGVWTNVGNAVAGNNSPVLLVHPSSPSAGRQFYRVSVYP
jgi:autotransporter-associated beta strand protein